MLGDLLRVSRYQARAVLVPAKTWVNVVLISPWPPPSVFSSRAPLFGHSFSSKQLENDSWIALKISRVNSKDMSWYVGDWRGEPCPVERSTSLLHRTIWQKVQKVPLHFYLHTFNHSYRHLLLRINARESTIPLPSMTLRGWGSLTCDCKLHLRRSRDKHFPPSSNLLHRCLATDWKSAWFLLESILLAIRTSQTWWVQMPVPEYRVSHPIFAHIYFYGISWHPRRLKHPMQVILVLN